MQQEHIRRFFGIPEHRVSTIHFLNRQGHGAALDEKVDQVIVEFIRVGKRFRCECGREFQGYYDSHEQLVTDLPWGPWQKVDLLVPRFRVNCPTCGVKTEPLEWIPRYGRYTRRLAEAVALACREVRSIQAIAEAFHLSWDTVKAIDKAALELELNPPKLGSVRHLAIDEFSIRRRHTYGTIFLDVEHNHVLWVCATREKQAVVDVFKNVFGEAVCQQIEAVSMDWWEAYESAVRECLPNAAVVWDLFHVVKKYNLEVIDRVRLQQAKNCQTQEERRAMKKTKFILLKNRENLVEDEPARLKELLRANRPLFKAYLLRDALRHLWRYSYPKAALKWFQGWYRRASRSRVPALVQFAHRIRERLDGVLAHCRYPIHSGTLEGLNNKVKVIKRLAYGFRDQQYFFLKIRSQFPAVHTLVEPDPG